MNPWDHRQDAGSAVHPGLGSSLCQRQAMQSLPETRPYRGSAGKGPGKQSFRGGALCLDRAVSGGAPHHGSAGMPWVACKDQEPPAEKRLGNGRSAQMEHQMDSHGQVRDKELCVDEYCEQRDSPDTMKAQLQLLQLEDPDAVFITRRINKLGFSSADQLRLYFSRFGTVKHVFVSHSRVKRSRHFTSTNRRAPSAHFRIRAAAQGFVVM